MKKGTPLHEKEKGQTRFSLSRSSNKSNSSFPKTELLKTKHTSKEKDVGDRTVVCEGRR